VILRGRYSNWGSHLVECAPCCWVTVTGSRQSPIRKQLWLPMYCESGSRGGAGPGRGYSRLSRIGDPAGQNVTERPATLLGCPFAPFWQLQLWPSGDWLCRYGLDRMEWSRGLGGGRGGGGGGGGGGCAEWRKKNPNKVVSIGDVGKPRPSVNQ